MVSPEQIAELSSMGLPSDYLILTPRFKREARLTSLRSWFSPDPDRANVLCTSVDNFVKAMRLWVEFYIKADPYNAGTYFWPDPTHKYEMVRMSMSNPTDSNMPSRTVLIAPRGTAKTVTFREMCVMICVCRTIHTQVVFSEINSVRTAEEFRRMKLQVERNATIQSDFGGEGVLFPASKQAGERWNDSVMEFVHCNTSMYGVSVNSAARGRHPHFGVIDDPEDDKRVREEGWRRKYFDWLFRTYIPMFAPGAKMVWMQTPPSEASAVYIPMRGTSSLKGWRAEGLDADKDPRFEGWSKKNFTLYYDDDKGERKSVWPHKYAVEDEQDLIQSMGRQAFMAEMQGIAVASGQFVFQRDSYKHGYMRTECGLMIDLRTGEQMDWNTFSSQLAVYIAADLSDSIAPDADPGALVCIGVSPDGFVYVLDAYNKRCHAEHLIHQGFYMAGAWDADKFGVEKEALGSIMVRYAHRESDKLRKKGLKPPIIKGVTHPRIKDQKIRRIVAALTPLHSEYLVRYPFWGDHEQYKPAHHPNKIYIEMLKEQVDFFTDEGASGHDDAIDGFGMAVDLAGVIRHRHQRQVESTSEREYRLWDEVGVTIDRNTVPRSCWTEKMRKEQAAVPVFDEVDPYEGT